MSCHTHVLPSLPPSLPLSLLPSLSPSFPPSQELVSALHGLTLLYEKQFHIAALNFSEGKRISAANLTTSVTSTGWIHVTIDPPDTENSVEGGTSLNLPAPQPPLNVPPLSHSLPGKAQHGISNGLDAHGGHTHNGEASQNPPDSVEPSLPHNLSGGSLANSTGDNKQFLESLPKGGASMVAAVRNWYQQIWRGIVYLASDPFPEVADLAQHVVHSLHDKVSLSCTCLYVHHVALCVLFVWVAAFLFFLLLRKLVCYTHCHVHVFPCTLYICKVLCKPSLYLLVNCRYIVYMYIYMNVHVHVCVLYV